MMSVNRQLVFDGPQTSTNARSPFLRDRRLMLGRCKSKRSYSEMPRHAQGPDLQPDCKALDD